MVLWSNNLNPPVWIHKNEVDTHCGSNRVPLDLSWMLTKTRSCSNTPDSNERSLNSAEAWQWPMHLNQVCWSRETHRTNRAVGHEDQRIEDHWAIRSNAISPCINMVILVLMESSLHPPFLEVIWEMVDLDRRQMFKYTWSTEKFSHFWSQIKPQWDYWGSQVKSHASFKHINSHHWDH